MKGRIVSSLAVVAAGALWISCSSSTGPAASAAGVWHVTVGALNSGSVSPSTFDITVTQVGNSYGLVMPALTYNGATFNTADTAIVSHDSLLGAAANVDTIMTSGACNPATSAGFIVTMNAARDTASGTFKVAPNPKYGPIPTPDGMCASGPVTLHK